MKWQPKAFPLIDLFHLSDDKMQTESNTFWIWVALMLSVTFGLCRCEPENRESLLWACTPRCPWWCSSLKKLHVCRSVMGAQHHPSSKRLGRHSFDLVSLFSEVAALSLSLSYTHIHPPQRFRTGSLSVSVSHPMPWEPSLTRQPCSCYYCFFNVAHSVAKHAGVANIYRMLKFSGSPKAEGFILQGP